MLEIWIILLNADTDMDIIADTDMDIIADTDVDIIADADVDMEIAGNMEQFVSGGCEWMYGSLVGAVYHTYTTLPPAPFLPGVS